MNFDSENGETISRLPALAYSAPEAVQPAGTTVATRAIAGGSTPMRQRRSSIHTSLIGRITNAPHSNPKSASPITEN
jgi:hypothetical protein